MAINIDFNDPGAWDDNALVDSWNEALAEYKKFHSIHAKGKSLLEVLTKEEIMDLEKRGIDLGNTQSENVENAAGADEDEEAGEEYEEEGGNGYEDMNGDVSLNVNSEDITITMREAQTQHQPSDAQIPEALMAAIPDQSLRNLMMSWYWTGYYTGYHQGQSDAKAGKT
jgi:hypothetical protein